MSRGGNNRALRAAVVGTVAGAAGTATMDLVQFGQYRQGGGKQKLLAWETAKGVDGWDTASGPGQFGKRLLDRFSGGEVPDHWARSTTNVVHWMTGLGWGAPFGLLNGSSDRRLWKSGLLFGPVVWLTSYVVLPVAKVYKPIWDYDTQTLAKDLWAHMTYGVVTAATFAALTRSLDAIGRG
jgi:hypothetical protein